MGDRGSVTSYTERWGFEHGEVLVPRAINSKASGRGKVTELVIW